MTAHAVTREVGATAGLPDGPRAPRAVQSLHWLARPAPFLAACAARYGDAFTLRLAHEPTWVLLSRPDWVREVFTGDPAVFHAGEGNQVLEPLVGRRSVLLLDDAPHLEQRRLLLPPFHGDRMQAYGETMARVARAEIASWPVPGVLATWPRMQAITLEVILAAVFGVRAGPRGDELREALRRLLDWTTSRRRLLLLAAAGPRRAARSTRLGFRAAKEPVDALLLDEIARRRRARTADAADDVLSLLLLARHEDGSPMSDEELLHELVTLLVAGHETTATALAWALALLARHPAALARARDEAASGEHAYVDAVARETLRLRPVLPVVVRVLTRPTVVAGRRLPAGVAVAPCIWLLHRRPDLYPEPEAFRPERFAGQPPGTYTWIPFGGGVRRCLGASFALFEMRVVLTEILARLHLAPVSRRPEAVARRAITLTPRHGARVRLAPA